MLRPLTFYRSSVGKKFMMAVTGAVLLSYVFGHMLGNLKVFQGQDKLDAYAEFLRDMGTPLFPHSSLLWIVRLVLLASVVIHITAAWQLTRMSQEARPVKYGRKESLALSYASRTMRWGGVIILAFVIYHLLHLTWGTVHPDFRSGSVYHNLVSGFQVWPVSIAYMVAMLVLGLHMYHGLWSAFQTLGATNPRYDRTIRRFAAAFSLVVVTGNIAIPASILAGIVS